LIWRRSDSTSEKSWPVVRVPISRLANSVFDFAELLAESIHAQID
jgi:hypothetical protein